VKEPSLQAQLDNSLGNGSHRCECSHFGVTKPAQVSVAIESLFISRPFRVKPILRPERFSQQPFAAGVVLYA
jgi:hypothetical protein